MTRQVYADNVDANGKATASIETVATKLNELMTALRKTKIVR